MSLLDKVRALDDEYHFMNVYAEDAAVGSGLLDGYAVSVKDNVCVKGVESKAGSKILEGYVPPFDATVVSKSRSEGGFIIGKTTQDEFGFGTFNVNTPYNIPLTPHDKERSTGGSSGGAACITSVADFPDLAISESTGGSITCPA